MPVLAARFKRLARCESLMWTTDITQPGWMQGRVYSDTLEVEVFNDRG